MADLTTLAPPIFADGNFLNRFADAAGSLVLSHANTLRKRLFDMARESFISFAGSAGDGTQIEVVSGLYDEGAQVTRIIDYIHILNHNLKEITIEFSTDNGSTFQTPIVLSGLTDPDTIHVPVNASLANFFRITAEDTQDPGDTKQIGNIILGKIRFQPAVGMDDYDPDPQLNIIEDAMGDGSRRRAYVFHADGSYKLREISVRFYLETPAVEKTFETNLLDNPLPFIFVPEPGFAPKDAHLCELDPDSWRPRYLSKHRAAGKMLSFSMQEKGGA